MRSQVAVLFGVIVAAGTVALAEPAAAPSGPARVAEAAGETGWHTFITARELARELDGPNAPLVIDVRSAKAYEAGHIPGAINIPGSGLRTAADEVGPNGEIVAEKTIFVNAQGFPDVARYEKIFSEAGLERDQDVVIYGNFAGNADGTVPVVILRWLGQHRVRFVEGVGTEEWTSIGRELSREPRRLPPSRYVAKPASGVIWQLDDVLGNLGNDEVVFFDCRTEEEFVGKDTRGTKHGGHIPGAVWLDSQSLLDQYSKRSVSREVVLEKLAERGITPDKTVVIYCQTGTRCTLPFLQLQDLGFEKVALYDASWTEYGDRDDTPKGDGRPSAAPAS